MADDKMTIGLYPKIRIYMDNCCFNRPYDDQTYKTIQLETEAKLHIQTFIKEGLIELVWSFILDFENSANPYKDRKEAIKEWKSISVDYINPIEKIRTYAKQLEFSYKIKPKDALHLACAIEANCNYLLTTDKIFLKKAEILKDIIIINPINFIIGWEEK